MSIIIRNIACVRIPWHMRFSALYVRYTEYAYFSAIGISWVKNFRSKVMQMLTASRFRALSGPAKRLKDDWYFFTRNPIIPYTPPVYKVKFRAVTIALRML